MFNGWQVLHNIIGDPINAWIKEKVLCTVNKLSKYPDQDFEKYSVSWIRCQFRRLGLQRKTEISHVYI